MWISFWLYTYNAQQILADGDCNKRYILNEVYEMLCKMSVA